MKNEIIAEASLSAIVLLRRVVLHSKDEEFAKRCALVADTLDEAINAPDAINLNDELSCGRVAPIRHGDSGVIYISVGPARFKAHGGGEWADGEAYVNADGALFVRDAEGMAAAFKRLDSALLANSAGWKPAPPEPNAAMMTAAFDALAKEGLQMSEWARRTMYGAMFAAMPGAAGISTSQPQGQNTDEVAAFWLPIITGEDGAIDKEKALAELADYSMVMRHYGHVLAHVTGGRISKLNTLPEVVCSVADDYYSESEQPQAEAMLPSKEALTDLIAKGLNDTYHCTRVWGAWGVGTMSEDDFAPVDESETPAELADAVLAMLAAQQPAQQPTQASAEDNWRQYATEGEHTAQAVIERHRRELQHVLRQYGAQPERQPRTDAEIVAQTEGLAAKLLDWRWGGILEGGSFRDSKNPRAASCWAMACSAQELLTDTDPENAAAEIDGNAGEGGAA